MLDRAGVRSSVARRLGVSTAGATETDRWTDGIVQMVLAAVTDLDRPLTAVDLLKKPGGSKNTSCRLADRPS